MRVYTYRRQFVSPGAVTALQLATGATKPIAIVRAWCSQVGSTTSAQTSIRLIRKTAAATVTAAVGTDFVDHDLSDPAASLQVGTALTGHTATVEGTDGDIIIAEGFNVLNGWLYLPVPEERIIVPAAGIVGVKFPVAPAAATYEIGVTFGELG